MTEPDFPLFNEYPRLREELPHVSLIQQTAVQHLATLGDAVGIPQLYMKRDDQTTEIYGGNKPRKLEFVLADVVEKKKEHVLTMGGTGSNHCLATSIFSKQLDLRPVLILFNQPITPNVQEKLLIFHSLGAELLGPYGEVGGLLQYLLFKRFRRNTYFMPAGGSSPLGVVGFVNAAFELKRQIEAGKCPKPDYLFVTCGTLGTMAGLLLGCELACLDIKIIGVRVVQTFVSLYNWTFSFDNAIRKLANKTARFLRKHDDSIPKVKLKEKPKVLHEFFGEGYGEPTAEGVEAIDLVTKHEQIALDTTYTGKTFAGLLQYAKNQGIQEAPILFWNTYNSRDISKLKDPIVTYKDLPESFQKIFELKE
jgi:1-aminocyclopropane-1-carboxylate deaminase/D-cysteine desulfhydrase-like pyridoxal-dependent ACC family enzyme